MNKLIGALALIGASAFAQQHTSRPTLWAFTGPWDDHSDSSLRANAKRLDAAVTGWIALDSATAKPMLPSDFPDTMQLGGLKRMALITSWHGDRFHPSTVRTLARDDARLAHAASAIVAHAVKLRYAGLVIDLESLEAADVPALLKVVKALTDSAHHRGISPVVVAVPAADSAAYPGRRLAAIADFIMPMLYDQHWSTSGPGPISSPTWVTATLRARVAEVGPSKVVAALPTYGYRWSAKAGTPAQSLGFMHAKRTAADARVSFTRDAKTKTLRAVKPGEWEMWITDAELLASLQRAATSMGVRHIALWRIGAEDPATWRALGR